MNQRIAIPIISVLAVGLIATGVFYLQGTNKLKAAQSEIVALEVGLADSEAEVSALGTELADSEARSSTLEAEASALGTELADAEAEVSALEKDLTASEARSSTLEAELADAEAEVSALEEDLTASKARSSTLEAELANAEARVSALETELAAAEAQISTLEIEQAAAALGSTKVYLVAERGFVPAIITVTVGTTVTWTNLTSEVHIVTSSPLFNSGRLSPGDSFSYTFTQQGVFNYSCGEEFCSIHDLLYGKVIVE